VEENKAKPIPKLKNDYGGHIQTAITQNVLGILKPTAYTYVLKQCVKISCNLEMVTRMAVAHFKLNDPLELLYTKSCFFYTSPHSGQNFRSSPWSRSVMLGSAESEHPRLTNGEIIFEDLQPM